MSSAMTITMSYAHSPTFPSLHLRHNSFSRDDNSGGEDPVSDVIQFSGNQLRVQAELLEIYFLSPTL